TQESRFLSENLVLYSVDRRPREVFFFERNQRNLVTRLVSELETRLKGGLPPQGESDDSDPTWDHPGDQPHPAASADPESSPEVQEPTEEIAPSAPASAVPYNPLLTLSPVEDLPRKGE